MNETSGLRYLHLDCFLKGSSDFLNVMRAIAQSRLERLRIDTIDSPVKYQVICESLPKLRNLQHFSFSLAYPEMSSQHLVRAVRASLSLERLVYISNTTNSSSHHNHHHHHEVLLNAADWKILNRYMERNRDLKQIMLKQQQQPSGQNIVVAETLWPTIFHNVRHCEYRANLIFRALLALGDAIGPNNNNA